MKVVGRRKRGFSRKALVGVVAPFVLVGLLAALVFDDDYSIGLALWQAVILWPIGGALLGAPVAIAGEVRSRVLHIGTNVLIAAAGVGSITLVVASDDAQAGIAFLYAPLLGCLVAGLAVGLDRLIIRGDTGCPACGSSVTPSLTSGYGSSRLWPTDTAEVVSWEWFESGVCDGCGLQLSRQRSEPTGDSGHVPWEAGQ